MVYNLYLDAMKSKPSSHGEVTKVALHAPTAIQSPVEKVVKKKSEVIGSEVVVAKSVLGASEAGKSEVGKSEVGKSEVEKSEVRNEIGKNEVGKDEVDAAVTTKEKSEDLDVKSAKSRKRTAKATKSSSPDSKKVKITKTPTESEKSGSSGSSSSSGSSEDSDHDAATKIYINQQIRQAESAKKHYESIGKTAKRKAEAGRSLQQTIKANKDEMKANKRRLESEKAGSSKQKVHDDICDRYDRSKKSDERYIHKRDYRDDSRGRTSTASTSQPCSSKSDSSKGIIIKISLSHN